MDAQVPPDLLSTRPTVKLLWVFIKYKQRATQRELVSATGLDRDTVRDALETLADFGYVERDGRACCDLRQRAWEYREA